MKLNLKNQTGEIQLRSGHSMFTGNKPRVITNDMYKEIINKTNSIDIPNENMGIRLEDDVVINDSGAPFNLMRNIPIDIEEIEDLMNN